MAEDEETARCKGKEVSELPIEELKRLPDGAKSHDQRAVERTELSNFLDRIVDRLDPTKQR